MTKLAILISPLAKKIFESKESTVDSEDMGLGGGTDVSHFKRDYAILKQAIEATGDIAYEFLSWNDPNIDWSKYAGHKALIYAPWNYLDDRNLFLRTLTQIRDKGVILLNSLETMYWNTDKRYLQDLKEWHIPIIPTVFADDTQEPVDISEKIAALLAENPCNDGIIFKPCVSAGGSNVFHLQPTHTADKISSPKVFETAPGIYAQHFKGQPFMIQPFLQEVRDEGEWSFVFLGGEYSHSFLRQTKSDGYKVQHSNDKEDKSNSLPEGMFAQVIDIFNKLAEKRKSHISPILRIDVIHRKDGSLQVMEIEQVDPFLYFYTKPEAAGKLIHAVLHYNPQLLNEHPRSLSTEIPS